MYAEAIVAALNAYEDAGGNEPWEEVLSEYLEVIDVDASCVADNSAEESVVLEDGTIITKPIFTHGTWRIAHRC